MDNSRHDLLRQTQEKNSSWNTKLVNEINSDWFQTNQDNYMNNRKHYTRSQNYLFKNAKQRPGHNNISDKILHNFFINGKIY